MSKKIVFSLLFTLLTVGAAAQANDLAEVSCGSEFVDQEAFSQGFTDKADESAFVDVEFERADGRTVPAEIEVNAEGKCSIRERKLSLRESADRYVRNLDPIELEKATAGNRSNKPGFAFYGSVAFMTAGFACDVISTDRALNAGAMEMNPLMRNRAVRIVSHVALPVAMYFLTKSLYKKGHKKAAIITNLIVGAAYTGITVHNLRVANSMK